MSRRLLLACAAAVATLACADRFHGEVVEPARAVADLAGASGGLRLAEQRGRVVVVAFGYTRCPDVCPMTLSRARAAWRLLGADAGRVTFAFATLDPERDTAAKLADYVHAFDPRFLPVRLEPAALRAALGSWDVRWLRKDAPHARRRGGAGPHYLIDHTSGFHLVDAAGALRVVVPLESPPDALAEDVRRLLREAEEPT